MLSICIIDMFLSMVQVLFFRNDFTRLWRWIQSLYFKARFGVGAKLRCFYRKHHVGGGHNYQATVVWRDGPAPRSFRTEAYLADLDKQAVSIKDNRPVAQNLFSKEIHTLTLFLNFIQSFQGIRKHVWQNCVTRLIRSEYGLNLRFVMQLYTSILAMRQGL